MIPEGENNRITEDFKLLQNAPLSGSVLISISSKETAPSRLSQIADSIIKKMDPSLLQIKDYSSATPQTVISYILQHAPNLTDKADLEKLRDQTTQQSVKSTLLNNKKTLLSPSGLGMKGIITTDPLNFRKIYLHKISSLQNLPRFKIQGKHFFNKDKSALLIIAKSSIPMMDSKNGKQLISHFNEIKKAALAENKELSSGIQISLLSGHIYTTANAAIVKRDILTVSLISAAALALLFLICFRKSGALTVFLAPGVAILTGIGSTALMFHPMSAIVIGFGAVLMGISIDFAVHVYFALTDSPHDKYKALQKVTKPVLFGAATSCAAFSALYVSGIPGIKQLAVFSVSGIIAACGYALLFIPNFCNEFPAIETKNHINFRSHTNKTAAICITLIIICAGSVAALSNSFDTELKNLGYLSSKIKQTERMFQEKWGNLRGQSMLFSIGSTMDEALQNNEKTWVEISENMPETKAVTLAPILPPIENQKKNITKWDTFWTEKHIEKISKKVNIEAVKLGFSPNAFQKSFQNLNKTPSLISVETMNQGPLAFLSELLIPKTSIPDQALVMTLLPDNKRVVDHFTPQLEQKLGTRLISQSKFKRSLEKEMKRDIIKFICFSAQLVTILILILFKNIRRSMLALLPALFGTVCTFAMLGILQIPLNIFHIVALPLVIGLGADYGIFMVFQEIKKPSSSTIKAVKISGLTTLAGFGVLIFAKHPSLHSLGAAVATGVSSALICAVFILPHLLRKDSLHGAHDV